MLPNEKPEPNPNIGAEFWLTPARIRVLYGGRSSSKSWEAALWAIFFAQRCTMKFLCVRQFQNKIEESVYTLLKNQIHRLELLDQFQIQNNKITHKFTGTEFVFYGLWRHIDEIKSMEGIDVCWIEEAHNLTQEQWQILDPTLRKSGSQFWIIFNPRIVTDFVYQRFVVNPPAGTIKKEINYFDNPFLSATMLAVIEELKQEDYDEYQHVYLGVPLDDDEAVIIKRIWLQAAIDAHTRLRFEPEGSRRIGFDVADDGGDRCVNVFAHGSVVLGLDAWKANEDELMKSCKRTMNNAWQWKSSIIYDATGVGAMAGSKFDEINEQGSYRTVEHSKFMAGGAVVNPEQDYSADMQNKDMFSNLKAQSWWLVADRFRNTWNAINNGAEYEPGELISISSDIDNLEQLLTELSTPKKDYDGAGRVKVESKKDLQKREINSPDLADAFIMAFAPQTVRSKGFMDLMMEGKVKTGRGSRNHIFSTHNF